MSQTISNQSVFYQTGHKSHKTQIATYLKQAIQNTDAEFEFVYGEYENTS